MSFLRPNFGECLWGHLGAQVGVQVNVYRILFFLAVYSLPLLCITIIVILCFLSGEYRNFGAVRN